MIFASGCYVSFIIIGIIEVCLQMQRSSGLGSASPSTIRLKTDWVFCGDLDEKYVQLDDCRKSLERNADMIALIDISEWLDYHEKGVAGWQKHTKTMSIVTQRHSLYWSTNSWRRVRIYPTLRLARTQRLFRVDQNHLSNYGQLRDQLKQAATALTELKGLQSPLKKQ